MVDAWRDPLQLFIRGHAAFGPTVGFHFGPYKYLLIHRPEDLRHVLVRNHANYHKSPTYEGLKLVLGNGLVTSEGAHWKRQRKLIQPAFHHRAIVELAGKMSRCGTEMLEGWEARGAAGDGSFSADIHAEMMKVTLRIVGHTLFSRELGGDAREIGDAIEVCLNHANQQAESLGLVPQWLPLPKNLRFRRSKAVLDRMVDQIVDERRRSGEVVHDLLGMLMSARDPEEEGATTGASRVEGVMSKQELRDEVMTLALAGHETTANALSWTLYELARHPEWKRRVHAEVDEVLGGRAATPDDMAALAVTGRVIDESMRLNPPVWAFERVALDDDEVGGYPIRKGTIVAVCTWTLHRQQEHWKDPAGFDPSRFEESRSSLRERFAYLPFGAGPRVCVGNAFAKMESKLLLADMLSRWDFSLHPDTRVEAEPGITLRPRHGLRMRLVRRKGR
jgi:cytochrome P450